jgi:hypothetical protein
MLKSSETVQTACTGHSLVRCKPLSGVAAVVAASISSAIASVVWLGACL